MLMVMVITSNCGTNNDDNTYTNDNDNNSDNNDSTNNDNDNDDNIDDKNNDNSSNNNSNNISNNNSSNSGTNSSRHFMFICRFNLLSFILLSSFYFIIISRTRESSRDTDAESSSCLEA